MGPNTAEISTAASYLLSTVKATESEKVTLSDMKNLKTVFNTSTAYDKYSVLNREYLTQPIHMQLYKKIKDIS